MDEALRKAAIDGDRFLAEKQAVAGADIDGRDRYGQTALMLAAVHGRLPVVDLLLSHGADPDVTGKYGLSALMLAIVNGHADIAAALLEAGADTQIKGTGAPGFSGKSAGDLAKERDYGTLVEAISRVPGKPV